MARNRRIDLTSAPAAQGQIIFRDNSNTKSVTISGPPTVSGSSYFLVLPPAPAAGVMKSDSGGTLQLSALVDADVSASAAIAYSKLNLAGNIVNADLATAANVSLSKLASVTINSALVSDGSGKISASAVSATELGYLSGVTSAIQTQLGNKAAKGANSDITSLTALSTPLSVPQGGTGTGTYAVADILYANTTTTLAKLPIGSSGLFLKSNGTGAAPSWASASGTSSIASKTTTYTLLSTDDTILADASGGAFTLNLPAAASNTGKVFRIKKIDATSPTNIITIDANLSETIDGSLTTTLNSQYETLTIQSDGSNWTVLGRAYPQTWTSYTPTFTGFGTVSTVEYFWRRVGDSIEIQGKAVAGTCTSVEARISLPLSLTASSAKVISIKNVGTLARSGATSDNFSMLAEPSIGYVTLSRWLGGGLTKEIATNSVGNGESFSIFVTVPITGWN